MSVPEIKKWFEVAVPNPTDDNRRVQYGVMTEECHEGLEQIKLQHPDDYHLPETTLEYALGQVQSLSTILKKDKNITLVIKDHEKFLDSLCDVIVTAVGTAHTQGYDIIGALNEVNRSNFSKFVDGKPVFNEHGKIAKGPDYSEPNLTPFIGNQR